MKKFNLTLLYSCKISWDYSKKKKCDNIIKEWQQNFKNLKLKRRNFLELLHNYCSEMKPSYMKGGPWIESFRFSNLLCARATHAIINHALIVEYWLHFFLREEFSCLCRLYPIKTRHHILYDCTRFNKGWNPDRETIF